MCSSPGWQPGERVRHADRAWRRTRPNSEPDAHRNNPACDPRRSNRRAARQYGASVVASYGPDDVRLLADTRLNVPFLLFSMSVTLATGIVVWNRSSLARLSERSWDRPRRPLAEPVLAGAQAGHSREVLVGVEMALATVLLASAGLLLHSFIKVMETDRGYSVERVLTADLSLFGQRYSAAEARAAFYRTLVENVRALPGVLAVGAISNLPALSASDGASRTIMYATDTDFQSVVLARPVAMIRGVTESYFAASGNPLRAGRLLATRNPTHSSDQRVSCGSVVAERNAGVNRRSPVPSRRCEGPADYRGGCRGGCPSWWPGPRAAAGHLSAVQAMGQWPHDHGCTKRTGTSNACRRCPC